MIILDKLDVVSSVIVSGGNIKSVKTANEIFVLVKNFRDSGEDVYVPAAFLCEGYDCNILNVEGMTVEI